MIGIDFGTSNSAVACWRGDGVARLLPLEGDATTMPTARLLQRRGPPHALRPRGHRAVPRRRRRPADALAQEPAGQRLMQEQTAVDDGLRELRGHHRALPARAGRPRRQRSWASAPACGASAGRCTSSTTTPGATGRPQDSAAPRRARRPASARSRSSSSRSPPPSTTSSASTRESLVLVVDIGGGTSDFTVVRLGPGPRAPARPRGRRPGHQRRAHRRHRLRPAPEPGARDAAAGLSATRAAAGAKCRAGVSSTCRPGT